MKVEQIVVRDASGAAAALQALSGWGAQWVLAFGAIAPLKALAEPLREAFPDAIRVGCSTAGEISNEGVTDNTCVVTAIRLDGSHLIEASTVLSHMEDSHAAGIRLSQQLPRDGLRAVLVLGQGVAINGSALIEGMSSVLGADVPITGGLAGDAAAFSETWVLSRDGVSAD
ncbi:MAG: FIST N-terminal domain-containing protein, partial [Inhella sp.]